MPRLHGSREEGASRGSAVLALLAILVVVLGLVYISQRRNVEVSSEEVERAGEAVAENVGEAVGSLRETSRDAVTVAKVKTALSLSKSVSAYGIDVDARGGTVTLSGRVPSMAAKEAAFRITEDVSGVERVVDRLDVGGAAVLDDEELATQAADAELRASAYESLLEAEEIDARGVRVLVEGGVVTLTGSVPTGAEKERVERIVSGIEGVRSVVNLLELRSDPRELTRRSSAYSPHSM